MSYPGDSFSSKSIPASYVKAHPALPNLINCQRHIAKFGDILHIVNNQTIPEDFYNKAIEINTDRSKTHFQGIIRHPSSNVFYLSGADKTNHASQLFIMEASKYLESATNSKKSKLKNGPLGSNVVVGRPDATKDRLKSIYKFSNDYWHGGGMDTEGEILTIPLENGEKSKSKISFLCIKDPLEPIPFKTADILRDKEKAGASALIRLKNGKYLCGVWTDSDDIKHRLDLYISKTDDLADGFLYGNDYKRFSIDWQDKAEWVGKRVRRRFQNFQFFRDTNDDIFCLATDNNWITSPATRGLNRTHLLKLIIDEDKLSGPNPQFDNAKVGYINEGKMNNVQLWYNFNAGCGFHITPEKKLALYSVAHWRNSQDAISMVEFYPPLEDTKKTITDIEDARVELYENKNFGLNLRGYMMHRCLKIVGKYNNKLNNFKEIKVHGRHFNDKVDSVKCILPKNYSLLLYKDKGHDGRSYKIPGTGKYQEIDNLSEKSKVGGEVSSMEIVKN